MNCGCFDYMLFGLRVRSELELGELAPAASDGDPDVWIRCGQIPIPAGQPGISTHEGAMLLTIDEVARYRVSGGTEVLIEKEPGVDPRNIRVFLLGSAFGALLHQRGLLPLHANAIEIDGNAVAFMGESGAGKSTLAAWFHDRGYHVLADDVCAVHLDEDGCPSVFPGLARLRLWSDAVDKSGRDQSALTRSFVNDAALAEKFDVPVERQSTSDRDFPLKAIFVLDRGDAFAVERLTGIAVAEVIFAHTYRGSFIASAGDSRKYWASVLQLARETPTFRMIRRWDYAYFDEDFAALLKEVEWIGAA